MIPGRESPMSVFERKNHLSFILWLFSIKILSSVCVVILMGIVWEFINQAQALSIFEVRRRLPMTNDEVTEKDFYINGGREKGIKPGMIVTVTRQLALYDSYQNKSPGDLVIPVGELKIVFVQKGVTVAREHSLFARKNLPVLEENFLMVGDQIDLGSARMESGERIPASEVNELKRKVSQGSTIDLSAQEADPKTAMESKSPENSSQAGSHSGEASPQPLP